MKRLNKHKEVILKLLRSVTTHPTADWIYIEVKKEIPNISLGTVYRNLNYLKDNNFILKLDYAGIMSRFDGNPDNHAHVACTQCGRVDDLEVMLKDSTLKEADDLSTYNISGYRLEFSGICQECL